MLLLKILKKYNPHQIPHFNAGVYLENKTKIGKIDEIFGGINDVHFSVKMADNMKAGSFKKGVLLLVSKKNCNLGKIWKLAIKQKKKLGIWEILKKSPEFLTKLLKNLDFKYNCVSICFVNMKAGSFKKSLLCWYVAVCLEGSSNRIQWT